MAFHFGVTLEDECFGERESRLVSEVSLLAIDVEHGSSELVVVFLETGFIGESVHLAFIIHCFTVFTLLK